MKKRKPFEEECEVNDTRKTMTFVVLRAQLKEEISSRTWLTRKYVAVGKSSFVEDENQLNAASEP